MKTMASIGVFLAVAMTMAMSASGADSIAVVDMRRVMDACPEVKEADETLRKQLAEFEAEQDGMLAEREDLLKEVRSAMAEAQNKALSDKGREEKKTVAEEKESSLRKLEVKIRETARLRQKQLADQERRIRERISDKVGVMIAAYAKEKGHTLVLDSAAVSFAGVKTVLYHVDAADITDDIIKIVGRKSAESGE